MNKQVVMALLLIALPSCSAGQDAAQQAEIERLRAETERLRAEANSLRQQQVINAPNERSAQAVADMRAETERVNAEQALRDARTNARFREGIRRRLEGQ